METWGITEKILQDTTDVMYQVLMVNLFKHLIKCDPNTQRLGGGGRGASKAEGRLGGCGLMKAEAGKCQA